MVLGMPHCASRTQCCLISFVSTWFRVGFLNCGLHRGRTDDEKVVTFPRQAPLIGRDSAARDHGTREFRCRVSHTLRPRRNKPRPLLAVDAGRCVLKSILEKSPRSATRPLDLPLTPSGPAS